MPTQRGVRGRGDESSDTLKFEAGGLASIGSLREADEQASQLTSTAGRYERGIELGRGAMGIVELAEDRDLRRNVALKTLLPQEAARPGARASLLREARLAGGLEHPNIIAVHELGSFPTGEPFFTMRRLEGRSLASILAALRQGEASTTESYGRVRLLSVFIQISMAAEFTATSSPATSCWVTSARCS